MIGNEQFVKVRLTPIFKENNGTNKDNYRPVRVFPNLSKVYESIKG